MRQTKTFQLARADVKHADKYWASKFNQSKLKYFIKGAIRLCNLRDTKATPAVKIFASSRLGNLCSYISVWVPKKLAVLTPLEARKCMDPFWKHLTLLYLETEHQGCISMFNVWKRQLKSAHLLHTLQKDYFHIAQYIQILAVNLRIRRKNWHFFLVMS